MPAPILMPVPACKPGLVSLTGGVRAYKSGRSFLFFMYFTIEPGTRPDKEAGTGLLIYIYDAQRGTKDEIF